MRSSLALALVSVFAVACSPSPASSAADDDDDDDDAKPGEAAVSSSGSSEAGSSSGGATSSSGGAPGAPAALGATTFVFQRDVGDGHEHLMAMDYATGEARTVATLQDGSVQGWNLDGISVSPDRTRIAIATLYGPTAEDVATGLATNGIWTLDVEGGDFQRLTPPFENPRPGNNAWRIDVRDPVYTPDGAQVLYNHGEGDGSGGYVAPWYVEAAGGSLPKPLDLAKNASCSVNGNLVFSPNGDMLIEHNVCIGSEPKGYFLYPKAGGAPDHLVNTDGVSFSSETPAYSPDGSVFVYSARLYDDNIQSLYAYVVADRRVVKLIPGAVGVDVMSAAFAPDNAHLVYCLRSDTTENLYVADLAVDPPAITQLTNDGASCDPIF